MRTKVECKRVIETCGMNAWSGGDMAGFEVDEAAKWNHRTFSGAVVALLLRTDIIFCIGDNRN